MCRDTCENGSVYGHVQESTGTQLRGGLGRKDEKITLKRHVEKGEQGWGTGAGSGRCPVSERSF